MANIQYLDFDLHIGRAETGYRAEVTDSPVGQASSQFALPFSDLELENFLLRMGGARTGTRRIETPEMEAAKTFGGRLFDAVFTDDVRSALSRSQDEAERQGMGLRVRLHLADAPDLSDLPWEYLYNPSLNFFLALSVKTPLVRYLDLPQRIRPLTVQRPLRALVMISSPSDYEPLDVTREFDKLKQALGDLEARGDLVLEKLEDASLANLQRYLREGEYHIFHFIGHGGFDERNQDGLLVLEDEQNRGHCVSAQYLGTILHDHDSLRLAILNACEGARTSRTDPFAGVAPTLVQQGIPAVIAMQFAITDRAAITFSHEFYSTLALGYPVDAALAEARKAIYADRNEIEWGTPVLYLRASDGKIFDLKAKSADASTPARPVREPLVPVPPKEQPAVAPAPSLKEGSVQGTPAVGTSVTIPHVGNLPIPPIPSPLMFVGIGTLILIFCLIGGVASGIIPILPRTTETPTPTSLPATWTPTSMSWTPTAMPTLGTPILTPTPIVTVIPTSSSLPPLVCKIQPAAPFASHWDTSLAGCPTDVMTTVRSQHATQQSFERGIMFWRGDEDTIYILYKSGLAAQFINTWVGTMKPDSCPSITVARGLTKPTNGFGKLWCEQSSVRTEIGAATETETYINWSIQPSQRGYMLSVSPENSIAPAKVYLIDGATKPGEIGKWIEK